MQPERHCSATPMAAATRIPTTAATTSSARPACTCNETQLGGIPISTFSARRSARSSATCKILTVGRRLPAGADRFRQFRFPQATGWTHYRGRLARHWQLTALMNQARAREQGRRIRTRRRDRDAQPVRRAPPGHGRAQPAVSSPATPSAERWHPDEPAHPEDGDKAVAVVPRSSGEVPQSRR